MLVWREPAKEQTQKSFRVGLDACGRKYVYQDVDELDKNHRENDDPIDNITEARMYEWKNSEYCTNFLKFFQLGSFENFINFDNDT